MDGTSPQFRTISIGFALAEVLLPTASGKPWCTDRRNDRNFVFVFGTVVALEHNVFGRLSLKEPLVRYVLQCIIFCRFWMLWHVYPVTCWKLSHQVPHFRLYCWIFCLKDRSHFHLFFSFHLFVCRFCCWKERCTLNHCIVHYFGP